MTINGPAQTVLAAAIEERDRAEQRVQRDISESLARLGRQRRDLEVIRGELRALRSPEVEPAPPGVEAAPEPIPSVALSSERDLLQFYEDVSEAWLVILGADYWPYLLTSSEDGDVFLQTFQEEDNPGGSGVLRLDQVPMNFYPVRVVAAG